MQCIAEQQSASFRQTSPAFLHVAACLIRSKLVLEEEVEGSGGDLRRLPRVSASASQSEKVSAPRADPRSGAGITLVTEQRKSGSNVVSCAERNCW